jgi:pyruvate dehydrogenase E1 component beta subunit/pre-rRNA-processing protein TSR1
MEKRAEDELEFEDEVEYNMDVQLRERYSKYTGLKNFSTATVDPYVEVL